MVQSCLIFIIAPSGKYVRYNIIFYLAVKVTGAAVRTEKFLKRSLCFPWIFLEVKLGLRIRSLFVLDPDPTFKTNVVVVLFYNYAFISVLIGKLIGRRCPLTDITNVGNKKLIKYR